MVPLTRETKTRAPSWKSVKIGISLQHIETHMENAQKRHRHAVKCVKIELFESNAQLFDNFQLQRGMAPLNHAEFSCGGAADINQAARDKRSSVVDPHHHGSTIGRIGQAHLCAKGQCFVRGGHGVHVEQLAIGGHPAMKPFAVKRRGTAPKAANDVMPFARWVDGGQINRPVIRAGLVQRRRGVERCEVFVKFSICCLRKGWGRTDG